MNEIPASNIKNERGGNRAPANADRPEAPEPAQDVAELADDDRKSGEEKISSRSTEKLKDSEAAAVRDSRAAEQIHRSSIIASDTGRPGYAHEPAGSGEAAQQVGRVT